METQKIDLLLEEFRQAWIHYRHLENMRAWYLGFLFTFAAGTAGWIAELLKDPTARRSVDAYFASLGLVSLLAALAITVYAAMTNNRVGRHHYARVWRRIRKKVYGADYPEINLLVDVYSDTAVRVSIISAGYTSGWLIITIALVSMTYLVLGALQIWPEIELRLWQRVVVWIVLVLLVIYLGVALNQAKRVYNKFRHPREDVDLAQDTYDESPKEMHAR